MPQYCMPKAKLLHLAHSRAAADTARANVGATAGCKAAHDSRCKESGEGEPEEGGDGLAFTAACVGTTSDDVGSDVALTGLLA